MAKLSILRKIDMLRLFVFWFVAFTIAVTSFPEVSFAQNSTFWMLQRQNNDRIMRENQRRMEQQRRDAERRRVEMERQRQLRRQQQEQQRRLAQQRQQEMQQRQQRLAAERRKMADQRRLQQQQRQQEIQKQQAQRKQLAQQQAQRTQLAARNRAMQVERQRRLQQIQQRNRLTQQNQQAQTAAQQSGTVAMLARQSSTARAATVASPKFQQRKAEAATRFAKLREGRTPAAAGGSGAGKDKSLLAVQKQLAQKKAQEFRNRQALKGARETKQDAATKARITERKLRYQAWRKELAKLPKNSLTAIEFFRLKRIAKEFNTTIYVVGSRASGQGRNINTNLPVGKGSGTRSDIDIKIDGQKDIDSRGALSQRLSQLSGNAGQSFPLIGGKPNGQFIAITPN